MSYELAIHPAAERDNAGLGATIAEGPQRTPAKGCELCIPARQARCGLQRHVAYELIQTRPARGMRLRANGAGRYGRALREMHSF